MVVTKTEHYELAMRTTLEMAWTMIATAACLCALCGCQPERQSQSLSLSPKVPQEADMASKDSHFPPFLDVEALHPVKVYYDIGNTVVVQTIINGVEWGKYIVPAYSSHIPFRGEGGFRLMPATDFPSGVYLPGGTTVWAKVYDYRRTIEKPLK